MFRQAARDERAAESRRHPEQAPPPLGVPVRCSYNVVVPAPRFVWDTRKSAANYRKHRVSFEEAQTVFEDERALLLDDPDHSAGEDRFVLLGMSAPLRLLVVCHCYREDGDVIRIISARKAAPVERRAYDKSWKP